MRLSRLLLSASAALLIAACVPSPTATPPRATPFPTLPPPPTDLPLPTVTLTREPLATLAPTATLSPSPTATATSAATLTPLPPTVVSVATPSVPGERVPPLLQVLTSETDELVSAGQVVALGVHAADDVGLAQIELYDEKNLYSTMPPLDPAPRTLSTVLTWSTQRNGPHHVRIIAYDQAGNASAPVELRFDVVNDNKRPTSQFTNYIGATNLPVGAPIILQGAATDDVAVTRVDLYVDDSLYSYFASETTDGETPLAVRFMWTPETAGVHHLYLRAHDNLDQTDDSPVLLVNALAAQPPALDARYEHTEVAQGGTLMVGALALSPNGVTRVELLDDDVIADQVSSSAIDGQSVLDTTLVWQAPTTSGTHSLQVRAYDRSGIANSSSPTAIRVRPPGTPYATTTPPAPLPTATLPGPTPTATPEVISPGPPSVLVATVQDPYSIVLPGPVRVRMNVRGSAELERLELWSFYQGETTPQLLYEDSIKGMTDNTLSYDWTPTRAGVAYLYARVTDRLGQRSKSDLTSVYLSPPPLATPTPGSISLAGDWTATIPTNRFAVSFVQLGRAVRGAMTDTPIDGSPAIGTLVAGAITKDRLAFTVAFDGDARPRSLDFDCVYISSPKQLACNYQDETGNQGSAIFTPVR